MTNVFDLSIALANAKLNETSQRQAMMHMEFVIRVCEIIGGESESMTKEQRFDLIKAELYRIIFKVGGERQ